MKRVALVADLGGTKIAVARVDEAGAIEALQRYPTPAAGGMAVVNAIARALRQLPPKGAVGIGIGVPGLAYPDGAVWAPNIPGWKRLPLGAELRTRFGLPVAVESDRNTFVSGEAWLGSAKNCRDVAFVAIGTGIGAGIISGGRLVRGWGELAGCVGWMAVRERFMTGYEAIGCLEFHVAGPGIARAAEAVLKRPIDAREVVRLARQGNVQAREVLAEAGRILGVGLANLVDILNPQMIVVGGGVAGELLLAPAREALRRWAQPLAGKQVRIRRSKLGGAGGLLGAAKLCFDQFNT